MSFTYQKQQIQGPGRSLAVPAPVAGAVPRVWHGTDYTLVTWHDRAGGRLLATIYSWNGRWDAFPLDPIPATIDPASLVVIPRAAFAVIAFRDTANNRDQFHILRRDPRRFGTWTTYLQTAPVGAGAGPTQLASGDEFFVSFNAAYTGPRFMGLGWSWRDQAWRTLPNPSIASDPGKTVILGAVRNAWLAISCDPAARTVAVQTIARDIAGRWSVLASWTSTNIQPYLIDNKPAIAMTTGDTFMTIAFVKTLTQGDPGSAGYEVRTWLWDERFYVVNMSAPYTYTAASTSGRANPRCSRSPSASPAHLATTASVSRYFGRRQPRHGRRSGLPAARELSFRLWNDVAAMSRAVNRG